MDTFEYPAEVVYARAAESKKVREELAHLRAIVEAAKLRVGDIKGIHTRWYSGQDTRPIGEIMSEIESLTYSVRCYLDGVPGAYLSAAS